MDDRAVSTVQTVLAETRWLPTPCPTEYLPALARDVLYALERAGMAWDDGYQAGLQQAISVVHAEARWQWELDQRRTVCAQVVAQRLGVVEDCLRGFQERAVATPQGATVNTDLPAREWLVPCPTCPHDESYHTKSGCLYCGCRTTEKGNP